MRTGTISTTVNEAFVCACRFEHEAVASLLLERSIALDPELGKHIDGSTGRRLFIKCFIDDNRTLRRSRALGLWKVFVMEQVRRAAPRWRPDGVRRRAAA